MHLITRFYGILILSLGELLVLFTLFELTVNQGFGTEVQGMATSQKAKKGDTEFNLQTQASFNE